MEENKTTRCVELTRFIKDVKKEGDHTNYETLKQVISQFKIFKKDCEVITTKIGNKNVVVVIGKHDILVYRYKFR